MRVPPRSQELKAGLLGPADVASEYANAASKDLDRTALGFLSVFKVPSELRLHLFVFANTYLLYWTRIGYCPQ